MINMEQHRSIWCKHLEIIDGGHDDQEEAADHEQTQLWISPAAVRLPETPTESMEFLARSWSISALQVSTALQLAGIPPPPHRRHDDQEKSWDSPPASDAHDRTTTSPSSSTPEFVRANSANPVLWKGRSRWLKLNHHHHDQKERKREEAVKADHQTYAAMSVVGVAAAVAAIATAKAAREEDGNGDDQSHDEGRASAAAAVATAAALVASYCVEVAGSVGARREDMAAAIINSAVNVKSSSDIMTLTAAAETALRGGSLMKMFKGASPVTANDEEITRNAGVTYQGCMHYVSNGGHLLKRTRKGILQWKHVSLYLNSDSQVVIKLKSKYMGGAIVKREKSIVYGICTEKEQAPRREETDEDTCLVLETGSGLMQFVCKNKKDRYMWTQGIQQLLSRSNENSFSFSIYEEKLS